MPLDLIADWRAAFEAAWQGREGLSISVPCPVCGAMALHQWYQVGRPIERLVAGRRFVAEGGLWQWCSNCGSYEHSSALVPEWWSCDLPVDKSKLTAEPEALEQALRRHGGREGS